MDWDWLRAHQQVPLAGMAPTAQMSPWAAPFTPAAPPTPNQQLMTSEQRGHGQQMVRPAAMPSGSRGTQEQHSHRAATLHASPPIIRYSEHPCHDQAFLARTSQPVVGFQYVQQAQYPHHGQPATHWPGSTASAATPPFFLQTPEGMQPIHFDQVYVEHGRRFQRAFPHHGFGPSVQPFQGYDAATQQQQPQLAEVLEESPTAHARGRRPSAAITISSASDVDMKVEASPSPEPALRQITTDGDLDILYSGTAFRVTGQKLSSASAFFRDELSRPDAAGVRAARGARRTLVVDGLPAECGPDELARFLTAVCKPWESVGKVTTKAAYLLCVMAWHFQLEYGELRRGQLNDFVNSMDLTYKLGRVESAAPTRLVQTMPPRSLFRVIYIAWVLNERRLYNAAVKEVVMRQPLDRTAAVGDIRALLSGPVQEQLRLARRTKEKHVAEAFEAYDGTLPSVRPHGQNRHSGRWACEGCGRKAHEGTGATTCSDRGCKGALDEIVCRKTDRRARYRDTLASKNLYPVQGLQDSRLYDVGEGFVTEASAGEGCGKNQKTALCNHAVNPWGSRLSRGMSAALERPLDLEVPR